MNARQEGSITIKKMEDHYSVVLENSKLKVTYGKHPRHSSQVYITEFLIKSAGVSQGDWLDAAAHRALLVNAELVYDGKDRQTVRMTWDPNENFKDQTISEITLYPDTAYLQYDYLQFGFPHIVDIGKPGGQGTQNHPDLAVEMYGADQWQALRQTVTDPDLVNRESKDHRLTRGLYPIYEFPIIDTPDWKGLEPEPMNYRGFLIMGVYNRTNKEGFGRVVSYAEVTYLKLLWKYGFEIFPFWRGQPAPRQFRSYLFPITKGAGEALAIGKQLATLTGE